jgi:hypothetical protein
LQLRPIFSPCWENLIGRGQTKVRRQNKLRRFIDRDTTRFMTKDFKDRTVTLSNGAGVSLLESARCFAVLQGFLDSPDSEWNLIYYLRQQCLGKTIDDEQRAALIREGLLEADGSASSAIEATVLSSVHGDGRILHLVSPFTEREDRMISEYIIARDELPEHVLDQISASDPKLGIRDAIDKTPVPPEITKQFKQMVRDTRRRISDQDSSPPSDDSTGGPHR